MLLLAADTSGKDGSIALARCGPGDECEVLEVAPLQGGTFSAQLVPQIAALLQKRRVSKNNIDGFAVVSGPGSFTGLRVGLAAIKALAEVLAKPIVAVSLLELVALSAGVSGRIIAALDAGRNEVYVGEHEVCGKDARTLSQRLLTRSEFLVAARGSTVVTPDPNLAEALRDRAAQIAEIAFPRADILAQAGWKKMQAGEVISPEALDANYIRRSDAEIFAKISS